MNQTLIFNGSPRGDGDTSALVRELVSRLGGDCRIVRADDPGISPCLDCRYCRENPGCRIPDGWCEVDRILRGCDGIVIASPIHFSGLPGPLLSVLSRLQAYWSARHFRNEELIPKAKRGGVVLVGGGDGSAGPAIAAAGILLRQMNAREIAPPVVFHGTDCRRAAEDAGSLAKIQELADFLSGASGA